MVIVIRLYCITKFYTVNYVTNRRGSSSLLLCNPTLIRVPQNTETLFNDFTQISTCEIKGGFSCNSPRYL